MVLVAVSVCLATIVLNLHYRKPSTHRMPVWVRNVLIQKMPGILFMRVPKQVGLTALLCVEGIAGQVVRAPHGSRRSKYLRQADPSLQAGLGKEEEEDISSQTRYTGAGGAVYLVLPSALQPGRIHRGQTERAAAEPPGLDLQRVPEADIGQRVGGAEEASLPAGEDCSQHSFHQDPHAAPG